MYGTIVNDIECSSALCLLSRTTNIPWKKYFKNMMYGALENLHTSAYYYQVHCGRVKQKNYQANFDYYFSFSALPLPPPQAPMFTIPLRPPCLQCSIVSNSFKSCYYLCFKIIKNNSISTISLYKATMPP